MPGIARSGAAFVRAAARFGSFAGRWPGSRAGFQAGARLRPQSGLHFAVQRNSGVRRSVPHRRFRIVAAIPAVPDAFFLHLRGCGNILSGICRRQSFSLRAKRNDALRHRNVIPLESSVIFRAAARRARPARKICALRKSAFGFCAVQNAPRREYLQFNEGRRSSPFLA